MADQHPLYTIGFTQKTAANFFELLARHSVERLVDTRLNNTGQLAGFSKKDDLSYFCKTILAAEYVHWVESAPDDQMLVAYKKKHLSWSEYAEEYLALMQKRKIENHAAMVLEKKSCLLCSEAKPHHCHRSLLAEYLRTKTGNSLNVVHLV